jgi:hypothetical protein
MSGNEAMSEAPAEVYRAGEEGARIQSAYWSTRAARVSNARLVAFLAILAVAWLAFGPRLISPAWLVLPVALFGALVVLHDRVLARASRAARMERFYADGRARLEYRFAGRGDAGLRHLAPDHPYARDLDLFGAGSLFELLATTRTREGSDRLAGWLLAPAQPAVVRARQQAVAELRHRLDLRLALALGGGESARRAGAGESEADPSARDALARWTGTPLRALPRALPWLAAGATGLTLLGAALWI